MNEVVETEKDKRWHLKYNMKLLCELIIDSDFALKSCCVQGYLHKRLHFEKFTFEAR